MASEGAKVQPLRGNPLWGMEVCIGKEVLTESVGKQRH